MEILSPCKFRHTAIGQIFLAFTYVAIFKSIKKLRFSFCSRSNCLSPFMGEFLERRMKTLVFLCLEYQHM